VQPTLLESVVWDLSNKQNQFHVFIENSPIVTNKLRLPVIWIKSEAISMWLLRDVEHRFYQSVQYFRNVTLFHCTRVNVILFLCNQSTACRALKVTKFTNDKTKLSTELLLQIFPVREINLGRKYRNSFTSISKVWLLIGRFIWNTLLFNKFLWESLALHFIRINHEVQKTRTIFRLCSLVTNDIHCTEFYETHKHSAVSWGSVVTPSNIWQETGKLQVETRFCPLVK
jgi:hypothetical protein